ncbi:AI-2E family transporter [Clostridium gelidum]|uniref:AI-2E family transporter n=1 Tax=Clostridium gelidum TaxID=704125 RepID=A0ABN6J0L3_9CLOT|nr:AI-2E family transporter [Clostridium gelidum]BCZ47880.1 AI-2E family transporter [Clostridium gelidum]
MKIEFDKKLIKYSIYVTITAVIIYVAFLIVLNVGTLFNNVFNILGYMLNLVKPLLISIIIAYLLYPVTRFIENFLQINKIYKVKKSSSRRVIAILCSYFLIIGILLGLLCGIYYMIGGQLSNNTTLTNIFQYISLNVNSSSFSTASINAALDGLNNSFIDTLKPYIIDGTNYLQNYVISNIGNMTSYIMSIGSSVATFFIALILSIYILNDSEYFISLSSTLYYLVFRKSKAGLKINYTFHVLNEVFGKFIRGQLLEAFFVGVLSAIALSIIGIKYAIVIGIIGGLSNMIPYVGPLVATVLAAIMGLLSGQPIKILYAIIAMQVVQQIDNNLLAPKIVGDSVGLHPVFTMMAILIGGTVGGLLGMLLAVPIAASIRVLFNNWYDNYMRSQDNS